MDYTKHPSLPDYLASTYGSQPFNSILDFVGSQPLYTNSPRYLHSAGPFVNLGGMDIEEGILGQISRWTANLWRPAWLGGVPRPFIMFSDVPRMSAVLSLVEMVKQGKLKVMVDSEFAMDDLMDAYERVGSKRARGKVLLRMYEHDL